MLAPAGFAKRDDPIVGLIPTAHARTVLVHMAIELCLPLHVTLGFEFSSVLVYNDVNVVEVLHTHVVDVPHLKFAQVVDQRTDVPDEECT
jgi:hypothetical protein